MAIDYFSDRWGFWWITDCIGGKVKVSSRRSQEGESGDVEDAPILGPHAFAMAVAQRVARAQWVGPGGITGIAYELCAEVLAQEEGEE